MKNIFKILVLLLGVLVASSVYSSFSIANQLTLTGSAATYESQEFIVINSIWGTPTANFQAGPGDQNVPLTVTLQYLYPYPSVSTEFEIKLPGGFTSTSSSMTGQDRSNATAYYVNRLEQGQIFQITLYLDLANNTSLGQYTFVSTIFWYAVLSNSTYMPEVYLQQNLNLVVNLNGNSHLMYSTNDTALTPDKINNIALTLTNSGSGNVTDVTTTVSDSSPTASILNELPSNLNLGSHSNLNETLQLFVPESAAGSILALNFVTSYLDPYQNQESTTQSLGFFVSSVASSSPLTYTINQTSLVPGAINNLTLTVTNSGQSPVFNVSTIVSSPTSSQSAVSASSQSISIVSQPTKVSNLAPGSTVTLSFGVFVSVSAAGNPVTLTVGSTYVTSSELGQSISNSYGLYVLNLTTNSSPAISVSELIDYVTTGVPSQVSIMIRNSGLQPIYNPTFSLSTTSPLFVSANSTYSMAGARINPGSGVVYEAIISSGPSSAVGVYGGSLTVSYLNQFGVASNQVVQVSFTLTGKIDLIVQGEIISQSSNSNLTLSGTLLNEGTVSAYYADAVGYVQGANPHSVVSTYIGEVDVNTPVPFTTTVPYVAGATPSTTNVTLLISYQDSFGRNLTYTTSMPVSLLSASQLSQQSSASATTSHPTTRVTGGLFLLIIIIVIIVLIVGIVAMRRRSSKKAGKKSKVI
jgi:hypothetical protein